MIAKGLDFPNVTLVGVINADTALHLPDFRAAERTFHLVTQVAGRTGRGEQGGRVLVQTFAPRRRRSWRPCDTTTPLSPGRELPHRQAAGYPPFASMVRIVVRGEATANTRALADELAGGCERDATDAVRVLGPAPAPMTKLRGQYRYQIQLQSVEGERLRTVIRTRDRRPQNAGGARLDGRRRSAGT